VRRVITAGALVVAALACGCDLASVLRFPTAPGSGNKVPPPEPLVGQVQDADGKPAAGVKIEAFQAREAPPGIASNAQVMGLLGNAGAGLIGNAGSGLIGNAGSGLAGNAGAGLTGANPFRRVAFVGGTTDASGSFFFRPDSDDDFNFEATGTSAKAWKLKLRVAKAATASLTLKLAATGAIAGTVTPAGTGSQDVIVVVPGSIYFTYAGTDGKFQLDGIPAGRFELRAARAGYKAAAIDHPNSIVVKPGETATVSLTLEPK